MSQFSYDKPPKCGWIPTAQTRTYQAFINACIALFIFLKILFLFKGIMVAFNECFLNLIQGICQTMSMVLLNLVLM